ncbi:hypothetical protein [Nonomuraea endophytica]|uniref:hypothetical protein n=1 Tax=Nonomuraea endophytica TaxID=714136 RepID=UPI0037C8C221
MINEEAAPVSTRRGPDHTFPQNREITMSLTAVGATDHYHVFAVQDWGGRQEFMRGERDRLTHEEAVQLVADMAEADTAYTGHHMAGVVSREQYEAIQEKFGDRFSDLISTNMCPGWNGIWVIPCGQECTFEEVFALPPEEWPGKPHWKPGTDSAEPPFEHRELTEEDLDAIGIALREEEAAKAVRHGVYNDDDLKVLGITQQEAEEARRERVVAHLASDFAPDVLKAALSKIEGR